MDIQLIGGRIKEAREQKEMTQKKLAELIEVTQQSLLKIEKGTTSPSMNTLFKIMEVLELTPNELLKGSENVKKYGVESPIARNLKSLRENSGLSENEFADKLEITPDELIQLEIGRLRPTRELLIKISYIFDVSEEELLKADSVHLLADEREILNLYKIKNFVPENARTMAECADTIHTHSYDEVTGQIKEKRITSVMQAQAYLKKNIDLENKSLDELIRIFQHICDDQIQKLTENI